jgi:segregation and condensation protein A
MMTEPITNQIVELDNFRGPLDLLLHLVREQEMEITEVALSRVCDQYLTTLHQMQQLDIDVAGDFLVIASTLMLIKSRTVLPREEVDLAEELDPADDLITQLLEYRRFKTLSMELGRRAEERQARVPRGGDEKPPDEERELAEISLWDLVGTFARLVEELDLERRFDALSTQRPLREFIRGLLDKLHARPTWTFRELLAGSETYENVFGVFLATLELVKTGQIDVMQDSCGAEISMKLKEGRDESLVAVLLGESVPEVAEDEITAAADVGAGDESRSESEDQGAERVTETPDGHDDGAPPAAV